MFSPRPGESIPERNRRINKIIIPIIIVGLLAVVGATVGRKALTRYLDRRELSQKIEAQSLLSQQRDSSARSAAKVRLADSLATRTKDSLAYIAAYEALPQTGKDSVAKFKKDSTAKREAEIADMLKSMKKASEKEAAEKARLARPIYSAPSSASSSSYSSGSQVGPRGGVYHYSASGKKVYEKH